MYAFVGIHNGTKYSNGFYCRYDKRTNTIMRKSIDSDAMPTTIAQYDFGTIVHLHLDYANELLLYTTSFMEKRYVGARAVVGAMKLDGSYRHTIVDDTMVRNVRT